MTPTAGWMLVVLPLPELATIAALAAGVTAIVAGAVAARRWALCWVLGHHVGRAQTESGVRLGATVALQFSLCVRCQRRFGD